MNYLLIYLNIIDQIIENHDKRRDPWKKVLNSFVPKVVPQPWMPPPSPHIEGDPILWVPHLGNTTHQNWRILKYHAKHSQGYINIFTHMRGRRWSNGAPPSFHTTSKTWKGETTYKAIQGLPHTICFYTRFKNMSKGDAQSTFLDCLHEMNMLLGTDLSCP